MKLNKSILGLTGTIEKFVESMGKIDKINDSATKKVRELTKAQDALGLTLKNNELVSKRTGNKVNEFGEEITKVGDKMLAFNKRSSILSETIKELNKNNERFNLGMKSFKEYQKRGGNLAEYLAEFISSSREEITIFGVEAAKARKVMYGFLPPGMFRMLNKISSTLQLAGGQYRKLFTDSQAAKKEIELLKKALDVATEEEEIKGLTERLAELEAPDNLFTNAFKSLSKAKKIIDKNITEPLMEGFEDLEGNWGQKLIKVFKQPRKAIKNMFNVFTFKKQIDELKKLNNMSKTIDDRFKKGRGMGFFSKQIDKAKDRISEIDTTLSSMDGLDKLTKQAENLAKSEGKRQEALEKHQQKIEELEESKKSKSTVEIAMIDEKIAKTQAHIATIKETAELQERVNADIEKTNKLTEERAKKENKIILMKAKERGTKNLMRDIKFQEKALIVRVKREKALGETMLFNQERRTLWQEREQEAINRGLAATTAAEQVSAKRDEERARKQKELFAADEEAAFTELKSSFEITTRDKETMDNDKEQLKLLKQDRKESLKKLLGQHPFFAGLFKIQKVVQQLLPIAGIVLRALAKYFILAFLAIAAAIVILRKIGPAFKEAFMNALETAMIFKDFIMEGVGRITGGLGKMFSFIFGGGTLEDFIDGAFQLAVGIAQTLLGLALAAITLSVGFIIEFGKIAFAFVKKKFFEFITNSEKLTKFVIGIVATIGIIMALIAGAPILVAVLIGAVIYKFGMKVLEPLTKAVGFIKDVVGYFVAGFFRVMQAFVNTIIAGLNKIPGVEIEKKTFGEDAMDYYNKNVVGNRMGGVSDGRMSVVGEGGRELVFLPKGSRVVSNAETEKMMGNKQPITNNFNITINAKDSSQTEMRRIADMIGRDISAKINRTTSSSTFR